MTFFLHNTCVHISHQFFIQGKKKINKFNELLIHKYHKSFGEVHDILQTELTLPHHEKVKLSDILGNY